MPRIYLDNNASTALDPRVLNAIVDELHQCEGNPSSTHSHGKRCRQRLEQARSLVAAFLGVKPQELVFTSSGTEGANLAIRGLIQDNVSGHIITSGSEHSCVYQVVKDLEKRGCQVSYLPTGMWGSVREEDVKMALRPDTKLITLMAVNNETGVKTDIEAIAPLAYKSGVPFVVDGVALLGKEPFSIPEGVTAMFFSGHKLHAPKGVGLLFCRQKAKLRPLFIGGEQEFNRRAGSENLPGIIGFAKAIEILNAEGEQASLHMRKMRDRLEEGLKASLDGIWINGDGPRVVNTTNISFDGVDGELLLMRLDQEGVSVSHGSACSSGALEPSRVLLDMGLPMARARSAIRFSVSRFTTESEIDHCIDIVTRLVQSLRS